MTRRFTLSLMVSLGLLLLNLPSQAQPALRQEGPLIYDGIPDAPLELLQKLESYHRVNGGVLVGWTASDGLLLAAGNPQRLSLYEMKTPGDREPVKVESGLLGTPVHRPGRPEQYFMTFDNGQGAETEQIYLQETSGPPPKLLTDGRSRYLSPWWCKDGGSIACSSSERNGRDLDATLVHPDGRRETLTRRPGRWYPLTQTPDGKSFVVLGCLPNDDHRLFIVDRARKRLRPVDTVREKVSMGSPVFMNDGRMVYLSNRDSDFQQLRRWNPKTGEDEPLLSLPWDVERVWRDRSEDRLTFTVNRHGLTVFYQWKPGYDAPSVLPIPGGLASNLRLSADGKEIAFNLDTGSAPTTVSSYNFETRKTRNWFTGWVPAGRRPDKLRTRIVSVPTHDGRTIFAYLTLPPSPSATTPVLLSIHGGPASQHSPYYNPLHEYLARERGVAVLAPNIRGSSGYGKFFQSLDDKALRENATKDIGSLLDWIDRQPNLDGGKVAIEGSSYGGFVTLLALASYPDRLRAGINTVGLSDLETMSRTTAPHMRPGFRQEFGDDRDPDQVAFMRALSPLHRKDELKSPLLVIHGDNDTRVPLSEADQIVRAVRSNGTECWYLRATDEGHGFRGFDNRLTRSAVMVQFLQRHLLDGKT